MSDETQEEAKEYGELFDDVIEMLEIHRYEGRQGLEGLAKLANVLGYKDRQHFGQFKGGCFGDLLDFFEDNPGALDAVFTWVRELEIPEWKKKLEEALEV